MVTAEELQKFYAILRRFAKSGLGEEGEMAAPKAAEVGNKYVTESMVYFEGTDIPFIVPKNYEIDQMDLDRDVCASGIKKFIRPLFLSENPNAIGNTHVSGPPITDDMMFTSNYILVEEVFPGVRNKKQVDIKWLS